jgi:hypothetical protein
MSLYSRAENEAQSIKVLNTTEKASVKKYESDGTLVAHDGNTNATSGAEGSAAIASRAIFVDATEAGLAENQERGLNAPGWWQYTSYTDASGATRHKAVHLAAFKSAPANTADSDDAVAADVASVITISVQPADVGDGATTLEVPAASDETFSVTAAADTGNLVYQWQRKTASSTRWVNITATLDSNAYTGFGGATLTVAQAALADLTLNGYQYRVKLTSDAGAEEVVSDAATLNLVDLV